MYGCERWTVKKAECRKIDGFELWCWRGLLRVPWTARRSNHILREISLWCSLEGLMLKLKLQYFGHLMQRADSLEKTLMLGKIEGRRRRRGQRMRWLDGITDSMDMGLVYSGSWWWTSRPDVLLLMGLQRLGHDWVTELNWTEWEEFWISQGLWIHPCFLAYAFLPVFFCASWIEELISTMERAFGVSSVSLQYTSNITQTITQSRMHMNFWQISWHRVFQDLIC